MHSCCCLTGLGLGLIRVVLVLTFWSCFPSPMVRNKGYSLESHDTEFSWMGTRAVAYFVSDLQLLNHHRVYVHISTEVCLTVHLHKQQSQKFSGARPPHSQEKGIALSQTPILQLYTHLLVWKVCGHWPWSISAQSCTV